MLSRNKLISRLNFINNRPKNNIISQERKFEIDLDNNYDYINDPDQLMNLWNETSNFVQKHPEIETWDEAMQQNPEWYDFSDAKNKKLSIFFNEYIRGNIPDSIKKIIENSLSSFDGKDFMSILKNLIKEISKFNGEPIYNKKIFEIDFQRFKDQQFYSWHYRSLSKTNRINWLNGAWQYFVDLLESFFGSKYFDYKSLRNLICTESNYYEFARIFDTSVFEMRNLEPVAPMTINMWNKIDTLWHSTFYFWCYSNEFENKPDHKYNNFHIPDHEIPLYEQRIRFNS